MNHHDRDATSLNEFIEVLNDGKKFYGDAAGNVNDTNLKSLLRRMAAHEMEVAGQLAIAVHSLGEKPTASGSVGGTLRNVFAGIAGTMAHDKKHEYVAQLEEFDDCIIHAFEHAAKSSEAPVRQLPTGIYRREVRSRFDT